MANNQSHLPVFYLLIILLSLTICCFHNAFAASYSHHSNNKTMRSLHFSLYQHETINKTGFIVVDGVAGAGVTQTTTPFGTIYVFRDNMTASAEYSSSSSSSFSSSVVGVAEGASITSSFDGLRSLSLAKITLKIDGYKGSISILGGTHNMKLSDYPVVGGTGDFLFVQGYIQPSPVDLNGLTVVYKIDFFLYWPPFHAPH